MPSSLQTISILGATGSIGVSTLDVISRHPDLYNLHAISANTQVELLLEQIKQFQPKYAVMRDAASAEKLVGMLKDSGITQTEVLSGEEGLINIASAPEVDTVMAAIVGGAGLSSTLAAVEAGKKVLLANKESLVMAGRLMMDKIVASGAQLLPIDSEHNAIFQCLPDAKHQNLSQMGVSKILLTGSGGPFRELPLSALHDVTPDQACAHPNWSMGRKISVDSATMMNKGLELIEACWLFNASPDQVDIVVHPQSIIHSMVQYVDGSVLAQLGNPDMRTPIAHALAHPQRITAGVEPLDIIAAARLDFSAPDYDRFPCLRLATEVIKSGQAAMIALNAANELAVEAFLSERIRFTDIPVIIEHVLSISSGIEPNTIESVQECDKQARALARDYISKSCAA